MVPFHGCGATLWRLVLYTIVVFWIERSVTRKEFSPVRFDGVFQNWEAALYCGPHVVEILMSWIPLLEGDLKLNVNGAARGKPGQSRIRGCIETIKGR